MSARSQQPAWRGRAPYRVSFSGGGTDLPFFTAEHRGAVLATTIAAYVYVTLLPRPDRQARVCSLDYDIVANYHLDEPLIDQQSQLRLFDALLHRLAPDRGFDLFIESEAPVGSGLGASGALAALTARLLADYIRRPLTRYQTAELAFAANRELLHDRVGRQDEYAATFGGFNYIEFSGDTTTVMPLRLRDELIGEIEHSFLLCHLPLQRSPHDPVNEQVRLYHEGNTEAINALLALRDLAGEMRDHLCRDDLNSFTQALQRSGELKGQSNPAARSPQVQYYIDLAASKGAVGGKLLGSGGGGYLLVVCGPGRRGEVAEALKAAGGEVVPFSLERQGVLTWQTKISDSPTLHQFYREWLEQHSSP
jgi:D-glycero-alpha-D-manno-heptose-7-phosphate kinase